MWDFTRRETGVLLFLLCSFIFGLCIRRYQYHYNPLPNISEDVSVPVNVSESNQIKNSKESKNISSVKGFVYLNQATQKELEQLPGIGPTIAERIVEYREHYGNFHSIKDLKNVKGIGVKTINKLKPYLKLN